MAIIPIKAQTWKRTDGSGKKRHMKASERAYYNELYAALYKAGFNQFPVPKPKQKGKPWEIVELRFTRLEFHFKQKHWPDFDNLLKAVLDAGQPSKWMLPKSHRAFVQDLWRDEQFNGADCLKRVRGSDGDYIIIEIEEVR